MIIGIHPDLIGTESYSTKWAEILRARGIEVRFLNLLAPDALQQASGCSGIMWRWAHHPQEKQSAQRILYTIEHILNIPVFPDSYTSWHYDEKTAQHYLLQALNAPVPPTWLFWEQQQALDWAKSAPYPLVFKLSAGAGSSNVQKIENASQAVPLIKQVFKRGIFPSSYNRNFHKSDVSVRKRFVWQLLRLRDAVIFTAGGNYPTLDRVYWKPEFGYAYFQKFLPGNEFDTRITIIGERAFGFRRLNRDNDFRASGSGKIQFEPELVDARCIQIAFEVSRRAKFQSMAYDFLYDSGKPVIGEISYSFADWAVERCPGHWTGNLSWVDGNMWPEEAQVDVFLNQVVDC